MKKLTTEIFIQNSKKIHGNRYDYSQTCYSSWKDKLKIKCLQHGIFEQRASDHTQGRGCPECAGVKRWNTTEFIKRAKEIHGNKYSYNKSVYTGVYKKTDIICKIHGLFKQTPGDHVNKKAGCPTCAKILRDKAETKTTKQFINDAIKQHGTKYNYNKTVYTHSHDKIIITCPSHGDFDQVASTHLYGSGCPVCAEEFKASISVSKGELEIREFLLNHLNCEILYNDRQIINPLELDIYIPTLNLAIEFCGLYWHSEQMGKNKHYHKQKHDLCLKKNIQLLTIFEDEWIYRRTQVEQKILSLINNLHDNKVYARKCNILEVRNNNKKVFFEKHHIQGNGPGSINIGLFNNKILVACASFIKKSDHYILNRFATSKPVIGGFSKILKHFRKNYPKLPIISFADQRWSNGKLYECTGWKLDKIIPADYYYIKNNKRIHKFNYRRKYLPKILESFDPNLSETENCNNNGILRIWDCGKRRYIYN